MFYGLLLERVVASKISARTFQSSSPAAAALGFLGKHILLSLQDYYSISLFIHHTRQGVSAGRGVVATTTQKQRQFGWLHPHAHRHTHSTQSLRTNTLAHSLTHTHVQTSYLVEIVSLSYEGLLLLFFLLHSVYLIFCIRAFIFCVGLICILIALCVSPSTSMNACTNFFSLYSFCTNSHGDEKLSFKCSHYV